MIGEERPANLPTTPAKLLQKAEWLISGLEALVEAEDAVPIGGNNNSALLAQSLFESYKELAAQVTKPASAVPKDDSFLHLLNSAAARLIDQAIRIRLVIFPPRPELFNPEATEGLYQALLNAAGIINAVVRETLTQKGTTKYGSFKAKYRALWQLDNTILVAASLFLIGMTKKQAESTYLVHAELLVDNFLAVNIRPDPPLAMDGDYISLQHFAGVLKLNIMCALSSLNKSSKIESQIEKLSKKLIDELGAEIQEASLRYDMLHLARNHFFLCRVYQLTGQETLYKKHYKLAVCFYAYITNHPDNSIITEIDMDILSQLTALGSGVGDET